MIISYLKRVPGYIWQGLKNVLRYMAYPDDEAIRRVQTSNPNSTNIHLPLTVVNPPSNEQVQTLWHPPTTPAELEFHVLLLSVKTLPGSKETYLPCKRALDLSTSPWHVYTTTNVASEDGLLWYTALLVAESPVALIDLNVAVADTEVITRNAFERIGVKVDLTTQPVKVTMLQSEKLILDNSLLDSGAKFPHRNYLLNNLDKYYNTDADALDYALTTDIGFYNEAIDNILTSIRTFTSAINDEPTPWSPLLRNDTLVLNMSYNDTSILVSKHKVSFSFSIRSLTMCIDSDISPDGKYQTVHRCDNLFAAIAEWDMGPQTFADCTRAEISNWYKVLLKETTFPDISPIFSKDGYEIRDSACSPLLTNTLLAFICPTYNLSRIVHGSLTLPAKTKLCDVIVVRPNLDLVIEYGLTVSDINDVDIDGLFLVSCEKVNPSSLLFSVKDLVGVWVPLLSVPEPRYSVCIVTPTFSPFMAVYYVKQLDRIISLAVNRKRIAIGVDPFPIRN